VIVTCFALQLFFDQLLLLAVECDDTDRRRLSGISSDVVEQSDNVLHLIDVLSIVVLAVYAMDTDRGGLRTRNSILRMGSFKPTAIERLLREINQRRMARTVMYGQDVFRHDLLRQCEQVRRASGQLNALERYWYTRRPLWPKLPDEMAKVMAEDLKAADIPVRDEAGRVIDFHALRHTFITRLARSGVTPKVAQALARHSTITLTLDRYAHMALADTSKALAILPAIPTGDTAEGPEDEAQQVAATGTDGPAVATGQAGNPCPTEANEGGELADPYGLRLADFGQNGETKSQRRSQRAEANQGQSASSGANTAVSSVNPSAGSATSRKPRKGRRLGRSCQREPTKKPTRARGLVSGASEADGTRTRNHRIDSPVL